MAILAATNIELSYGERVILDQVSLSLDRGERLGLVGRNGEGKSTLLKILAGKLAPDRGTVVLAGGARTGYLAQDPELDPNESLRLSAEGAFQRLHDLHAELEKVFDDMAGATGPELEKLLAKQSELERRVETAGGYAISHRIDEVLSGLGFSPAQYSVKVRDLSGGQKNRLALARLLLDMPDVLLLDEPTNHLDLDGRLWLESFLRDEYRGAVVLISHDRYLLDAVVGRIVEVERTRLVDYPGDYSTFRRLRAERRMAQLRAWENQQSKFKKEEAFIRKYKAGQRARQAKGRESRLEREKDATTIDRPIEMEAFRLRLPKAERTGEVVVSTKALAKSYPNEDGTRKVLFHNLDLKIGRGERWGIIGPNGAGKTTLVRCVLGQIPADEGEIRLGTNVSIGYFSQKDEGIDPDKAVYRYLQDVIRKENPDAAMTEQEARDLAGAFLFSGGEQDRPMGVLSGGERGRARLAALLASSKNVLVLDEPTNHLDIPSAERLEQALTLHRASPEELAMGTATGAGDGRGYEGAVILISHDRALIDAVCDHLLILDGEGGAEIILGNYSEWCRRRAEQQSQSSTNSATSATIPSRGMATPSNPSSKHANINSKSNNSNQPAGKPSPTPRHTGSTPASTTASSSTTGFTAQPSKPKRKSPFSWMPTDKLEAEITQLEIEVGTLDAKLADPDVWTNPDKSMRLTKERDELATKLAQYEEEWLSRAES